MTLLNYCNQTATFRADLLCVQVIHVSTELRNIEHCVRVGTTEIYFSATTTQLLTTSIYTKRIPSISNITRHSQQQVPGKNSAKNLRSTDEARRL